MTPDKKLSDHFTLYQLTRTDHSDLQEENRHVTEEEENKLKAVAGLLETGMDILQLELDIHSGRRYLELNKRVGGSERSQHLKCEAVDFSSKGPDTENSVNAIFSQLVVAANYDKIKFGQLIVESVNQGREGRKFWVHISLGAPYRHASRCGQCLRMKDGKYEMVATIA